MKVAQPNANDYASQGNVSLANNDVIKLPNETVAELRGRCEGLANWEEGRWRVFEPIF